MRVLWFASLLFCLVMHGGLAIPHVVQRMESAIATQHAVRDVAKTTNSPPVPVSTCPYYATITEGPACAGCILEAIRPQQLSYPGKVIYLTKTIVSYTVVYADGCTGYEVSTVPVNCSGCETIVSKPAELSWVWKGATLAYPTTYLGYDCFQLATWSPDEIKDSACTFEPTTIARPQVPLVFPATAKPDLYMPVPSAIIDIFKHDPNITSYFDIGACSVRGLSFGTCQRFPGSELLLPPAAGILDASSSSSSSSFTPPVSYKIKTAGVVNETKTEYWWKTTTGTLEPLTASPNSTTITRGGPTTETVDGLSGKQGVTATSSTTTTDTVTLDAESTSLKSSTKTISGSKPSVDASSGSSSTKSAKF